MIASLALVFASAGAASATQLAGPASHPPAVVATTGPHVKLSPSSGPPTTTVTVSGSGFGATEGVDVYFDTTDLALAGTSATGSFGPVTITVPASASPGKHWVSAEGRHSGLFAQTTFTISTNWAQFHYAHKLQGSNPYENMLNPGNVSGIDEVGSYTTGNAVFSSPAVVGGVVYIGSEDGKVYALNATTGAREWSYTTGGPVYSSPAVANGVVYVGSNDGNVYAFSQAGGLAAAASPLHGSLPPNYRLQEQRP